MRVGLLYRTDDRLHCLQHFVSPSDIAVSQAGFKSVVCVNRYWSHETDRFFFKLQDHGNTSIWAIDLNVRYKNAVRPLCTGVSAYLNRFFIFFIDLFLFLYTLLWSCNLCMRAR